MMKKYFLVSFLILQSIFLQGQNKLNKDEKLPPKKWEFGIQSNIILTNRIYVEKYLKNNVSIKTSLAHEFYFLFSLLALESEFHYYFKEKEIGKIGTPFLYGGISLRSSFLLFDFSIDTEDRLENDPSAKHVGMNYYLTPIRLYYFDFHGGIGFKKQITKKVHFEYGGDVYLLKSTYYVISDRFVPTFTLRLGWQWN